MSKYFQLLFKIEIHPLLWLIIGIGVITANFRELLMLFFIILVHEMGHAICAHFFSWRIKKIALLPFGGVAEMDEHGNRPLHEELFVILAGPLQHVWLVGISYLLSLLSIISTDTFNLFLYQNLVICGFNLLPIWPLDGGKLLYLFFSIRHSFFDAHKRMLIASIFGVSLLITWLLFYNPINVNLWVIILFLLFSLYMEWRKRHFVFMRFLLERYYGRQTELTKLKPLVVDENDKVYHVLSMFQRGYKHPIVIKKNGTKQMPLDENELLHAYFTEKNFFQPVGELLYLY
ncbi:M50 family metallopeptidase [Ferdinandcohnia quinoae]|uniref:M50 family metallopeptidase n=1 Tax=Fredinandcohnia quinoae TaxID=2918902 RepID=A0AAW5E9J9_9BACI|nr:M50 family metallopeptidase [Fredinandcohnia sp. SECRCQ15]MCH1626557.1 M50 family metallopeptidase [Fredinandcohnia sp. SECRCQ15]